MMKKMKKPISSTLICNGVIKRIFLLVLLFPTTLGIAQTGNIKGYTYDQNDNEALMYTSIELLETGQKVFSDEYGQFYFGNIEPGDYKLRVSFVGLLDTIIPVTVVLNQTTEITVSTAYCPYDHEDKTCPQCLKSDKVIPIVYGYPSKGLMRKAKKGKVLLGGCVISGCDPNWHCKRDNHSF